MAAEALEIRMARLEGAYQQIDKRLALIETDLRDLREDVRGSRTELLGDLGGLRGEMRGELGELRGDMRQQFYWVVGLIVVTILVPIALRFLNP